MSVSSAPCWRWFCWLQSSCAAGAATRKSNRKAQWRANPGRGGFYGAFPALRPAGLRPTLPELPARCPAGGRRPGRSLKKACVRKTANAESWGCGPTFVIGWEISAFGRHAAAIFHQVAKSCPQFSDSAYPVSRRCPSFSDLRAGGQKSPCFASRHTQKQKFMAVIL